MDIALFKGIHDLWACVKTDLQELIRSKPGRFGNTFSHVHYITAHVNNDFCVRIGIQSGAKNRNGQVWIRSISSITVYDCNSHTMFFEYDPCAIFSLSA